MDNISQRMRAVIEEKTSATRRHKELEAATGLEADAWKAWWNGRQRPNEEMIQAVARAWPQYALWIAIGETDPLHGHNDPYGPPDTGLMSLEGPTVMYHETAGRLLRAKLDRRKHIAEMTAENPDFDGDEQLQRMDARIAQLSKLRELEEQTMNGTSGEENDR